MNKALANEPAEPRPGLSVRLFLADGSPHGLITAAIGNWSGRVMSAPRNRLDRLLRRSESGRTGIYLMSGPDPDKDGGLLVYVGEADNVARRIRVHLQQGDTDFFDRVAIIVSTDEFLQKSHARYLESRLIGLAREAGVCTLANMNEPVFRRLSESDRADMDTFIGQLQLILPLVGFDLLRSRSPVATAEASPVTADIFEFSTAGASATALETEEGFVVLAGSTARIRPTESFPAGTLALRDRLVRRGLLVEAGDGQLYRFTEDVIFASPSAAASVVSARAASGPREWTLARTGEHYGKRRTPDAEH